MSQQKQNILIIETKDGAKYQGIFVSKDIKKQIITLANVKKTFQGKEESIPNIEITKDNIERINIIDFRPPKEDIHNFNEIPQNKKSVVDENKLANVEKAYDKSKDDFFDHLKPMTNPEAKKESRNYNQKNKDTFNLPENYYDDNQREWKNRGNRRGYGQRGRGGYGRGNRGGYNNYYKNNRGRNNNYGNDGNHNYRGQNYRGRVNRGRGRGRGNRGGYKKNNYNQENNQNNNVNSQEENNKETNQP